MGLSNKYKVYVAHLFFDTEISFCLSCKGSVPL